MWLVASMILVYLLILFNQKTTGVSEKPQKKKPTSVQLREIDARVGVKANVLLFDRKPSARSRARNKVKY